MESMKFKIRPAREDDIAELLRCYEWLFAPPGAPPARWNEQEAGAALREAISYETATVLVAEADTVLIGFVTAYQDLRSVRFGLRTWVEDLAVAPQHRSRGVGKALLDAAKAWAREHGATRLAPRLRRSPQGRPPLLRARAPELPLDQFRLVSLSLVRPRSS